LILYKKATLLLKDYKLISYQNKKTNKTNECINEYIVKPINSILKMVNNYCYFVIIDVLLN